MTALDWALAIDASARMLERAGVPRPEVVQKEQRAISREKEKLRRKRESAEAEPESAEPVDTPRRITSG